MLKYLKTYSPAAEQRTVGHNADSVPFITLQITYVILSVGIKKVVISK